MVPTLRRRVLLAQGFKLNLGPDGKPAPGGSRRANARAEEAARQRNEAEVRRSEPWRVVPHLRQAMALKQEVAHHTFTYDKAPPERPAEPPIAAARPTRVSWLLPTALVALVGTGLTAGTCAGAIWMPAYALPIAGAAGALLFGSYLLVRLLAWLRARGVAKRALAHDPTDPLRHPTPWRARQDAWLAEVAAWEEARDLAREDFERRDRARVHRARRVQKGEVVATEEAIGWALGDMPFPFDAECRFDVVDPSLARMVVDLPAGKPDQACGVGLLLARIVFATAPTIKKLRLAGRTGAEQYAYNCDISRDWSAALDHATCNPHDAIHRMPAARW